MATFFDCGAGSHVGDKTIPVVAEANPSNEWRQGTIVVNSGIGKTEVVMVKQAPNNIVQIPVSDFLVMKYSWSDSLDGIDYDSATCFRNTGQGALDNKFVGWSKNMANSESNVSGVLRWGGDNQLSGAESIMVNMKDLLNNYTSLPQNIDIAIYGNWYEAKVSGNVTIEFIAYLGGTMSLNNYVWSNSGGNVVFTGSKQVNVAATGNNNWTDFNSLYSYVGKFVYDKVNKDGLIIFG